MYTQQSPGLGRATVEGEAVYVDAYIVGVCVYVCGCGWVGMGMWVFVCILNYTVLTQWDTVFLH